MHSFPFRSLVRSTLSVIAVALAASTLAAKPTDISEPANDVGENDTYLDLGHPAEHIAIGDDGPTLILLPCWNCRWKEFEPFMERNAAKYRMHAITFPGQGGARAPALPLFSGGLVWQENAVQSVLSVMEQTGTEKITFVASSWGVKTAIEIASRFPERVAGIVNLDGQTVYSKSAMSLTGDPAEFEQGSVTVARDVLAKYLIPELKTDLDAWQNMNWVSLADSKHRMLVHGWFMATPQELMFNTWFENIVDTPTHNQRFSNLKTRFLDVRALRPHWNDEQKAKRRADYRDLFVQEGTSLPENYVRTWINDSQHLVPLSNLDAMERIVEDFLGGQKIHESY